MEWLEDILHELNEQIAHIGQVVSSRNQFMLENVDSFNGSRFPFVGGWSQFEILAVGASPGGLIRGQSSSPQRQGSVERTGSHDPLRRRIWNQNASPLPLKTRILLSSNGAVRFLEWPKDGKWSRAVGVGNA